MAEVDLFILVEIVEELNQLSYGHGSGDLVRGVSFPFCFHGENHFGLRCWLFCFSGGVVAAPVYNAYNAMVFVDSQ